MAIVTINTPQGPLRVDIEGMSPSEEEMEIIRENAPAPDGEEFDYTLSDEDSDKLSGMGNAPEIEDAPTQPVPTQEVKSAQPEMGEVENVNFRFSFNRMDNDSEKIGWLTENLGPDTFKKVASDTFIIDQSKVNPEIRSKYGLADSGFVYADKPTLSWYDVADFGGSSGAALIGGIGASIAVAGTMAAAPAILAVGAVAGVAKGIDEAVEYFQGYNSQSAGEVATAIGWSAVEHGGGEGFGRGLGWLFGRIFKGKGAAYPAERVDEILAANPGMKTKKAEKFAKEEAMANVTKLTNQGARVTVGAATGKDVSNTMLAINEKIIPNTDIGKGNVKWIKEQMDDIAEGRVSTKEGKEILQNEGRAIANSITKQLDDPEKVSLITNQHLENVIKPELDILQKLYNPSTGIPSEYTHILPLTTKLFQSESSAFYKTAENVIGKEASSFNMNTIQKAVSDLRTSNVFLMSESKLFNIIEDTPSMSLEQLTQLRQALRLSASDPALVPTAFQGGIGKVINSVDETINAKFVELSQDLANGYRTVKLDNGNVFQLGFGPAESESLRQGLSLWRGANKFYTQGQDEFNNLAVNMLMKNTKNKYFTSNIDIAGNIIENINAPRLKMYLDAVTPKGKAALELSKPEATQSLQTISALVSQGKYSEANSIISKVFPEGSVPKMNDWISKLGPDDVYTKAHLEDYTKQLKELTQLSIGGASPIMFREAARNGLAKTWLEQTRLSSLQANGALDAPVFFKKFRDLGDDVRDTLFGKDASKLINSTMKDAIILGTKGDELLQNASFVTNQPLRQQLLNLKAAFKLEKELSADEVLRVIERGGPIQEPEKLIAGLVENPNSYTKLKSIVSPEELDKVGGIKDMAMKTLLSKTTPLAPKVVQTGEWGRSLLDSIAAMNSKGGLDNILGKDVVGKLEKLAKDSVFVSDESLKGLGGLIAPSKRAGVPGNVGTALSSVVTLGLVGGGLLAGVSPLITSLIVPVAGAKILRNKTILNLMTSTRLRANLYDEAIKAGANLPSRADARKANVNIWMWNNHIQPAINSVFAQVEASLIGSTSRNLSREATEININEPSSASPQRPQKAAPIRSVIDPQDELKKAAASGALSSGNPLRQLEQEKMLGIR